MFLHSCFCNTMLLKHHYLMNLNYNRDRIFTQSLNIYYQASTGRVLGSWSGSGSGGDLASDGPSGAPCVPSMPLP